MTPFSRLGYCFGTLGAFLTLCGNLAANEQLPLKPPVTVRDVILLHEIGGRAGDRSLSISPDKRSVAFQVIDANLGTNTYKLSWYASVIETPNNARLVSAGGAPILASARLGRKLGVMAEAKAEWSPDGQWIAFLREDGGVVQVWRARADGSREEQITHSDMVVERFQWKADGTAIYYEAGRSRTAMRQFELREQALGQLLDDRFVPYYSLKPLWFTCGREDTGLNFPIPASQECTPSLRVIEFGKPERQALPADVLDYHALTQKHGPEANSSRRIEQLAWNPPGTHAAWLENENILSEPGFGAPLRVRTDRYRCNASECGGTLRGVWWHEGEVIFRRWEGHGNSIAAVYAWHPGAEHVRLVYRFDGILDSCDVARFSLVCLSEAPKSPRSVVAINLRSGKLSTVFDPNLEFQRFDLGSVRKLEWTDGFGNDVFGHLVYPPGYKAGRRYPLVVVQYGSRGFLNGGTGDEYPIFPLASSGFLVLSFEMPGDAKLDARYDVTSLAGMESYMRGEWGDAYMQRRSLSALELILDRLEMEGVVDSGKVGITGLSNGALVVDYALLYSKRFQAAAVSGGSTPDEYLFDVNDSVRALLKAVLPEPVSPLRDAAPVWRQWYIAYNADRITAPLLIQYADRELIPGLPEFIGAKDAGIPIEAYVFPDEYHIKWQPQHKLAAGQRAIDWLQFWLQGRERSEVEDPEQYSRWRRLRERRDALARARNPDERDRAASGAEATAEPHPPL